MIKVTEYVHVNKQTSNTIA